MAKTVAAKARVKPGIKVAVLNSVRAVVTSLGLPNDARFVDAREAELVMLFAESRATLNSQMTAAVKTLAPGAALWVFFRKGSRAAGLDMNRNDVWAVAEQLELRPVGLVSVDDTWSVFRLRAK